MSKNSPLYLYGSGGHATSVLASMLEDCLEISGIIDNFPNQQRILGHSISTNLFEIPREAKFVLAIGDNFRRRNIARMILENFGDSALATYISKNSFVSKHASIGLGSVVMVGAYIGPNVKIGECVLVNTHAIIEHDCTIGTFSSFAPGSILAGQVEIGNLTGIGPNSFVESKVHVGDNCLLGANSYLRQNLSSNYVAFGSPARIMRSREEGDTYLR